MSDEKYGVWITESDGSRGKWLIDCGEPWSGPMEEARTLKGEMATNNPQLRYAVAVYDARRNDELDLVTELRAKNEELAELLRESRDEVVDLARDHREAIEALDLQNGVKLALLKGRNDLLEKVAQAAAHYRETATRPTIYSAVQNTMAREALDRVLLEYVVPIVEKAK